jgi:hypothetical protein
MRNSNNGPSKYLSTKRGTKVEKSLQHPEMYLLTNIHTGKGHQITSCDEVMHSMYPVDKVIRP